MILVTGATDGLGREVARALVQDGHEVLIHGRNADKLRAAAADVGAAGTFLADFSRLADVRRLARETRWIASPGSSR